MTQNQEYLIKTDSYFTLDTTFAEVITVLIKKNLTHFPVLENGIFIGNISLIDAETLAQEKTIRESRSSLEFFHAKDNSFWFEILEISSKNDSNMIPVLNFDNKMIGYFILEDIISIFNESAFIKETGITVVIEKELNSYSISQISQIFEINNSKIFGIILNEIAENKAQIIIKATTINTNEVIQSLRRYGYNIISEHLEDQFLSDLKNRSDYLDKYLNV